jgi:DNA invertase Pin-like site-specific DNA recombinase
MQIALYARVSKKNSKQDTENQLAQLRDFARSQNWTIVHEYVDRATGKHSDREQFQRLFEDASQHKFDLVLFWSLDRFSREGVKATLDHLQRLSSYNVGYRSFTEQYLDSCGIFKDAVLSIKMRSCRSWPRSPARAHPHQRTRNRRPRTRPQVRQHHRQAAVGGRPRSHRPTGRRWLDGARDWRGDGLLCGRNLPDSQGAPAPPTRSVGAGLR